MKPQGINLKLFNTIYLSIQTGCGENYRSCCTYLIKAVVWSVIDQRFKACCGGCGKNYRSEFQSMLYLSIQSGCVEVYRSEVQSMLWGSL